MVNTTLTDAFNQAVIYWIYNENSTRGGLIAHLERKVGISNATAARWADAVTKAAFDLGFSKNTTYASFKSWMTEVGSDRYLVGIKFVFEHLRKGPLTQEAISEKLTSIDDNIVATDITIAAVEAAVNVIKKQEVSDTQTTVLAALTVYQNKLNRIRATKVRERDIIATE